MSASTFTYKPLREDDAIRLLFLEPSTSHAAELRGTLFNTTLSARDYDLIEPYTALSYVWGTYNEDGQIILDGVEFKITSSLDAALRDLRDDHRVRHVWADALCINQNDFPERSRQVKLMGQIYSTAHHTVVYLGASTPDTEMVLMKVSGQGPDRQAVIDVAKRDILLRAWFRRVWIFQELVLSKDPWVQCGTQRVRWGAFCNLLLSSRSGDRSETLGMLASMNNTRGSSAGDLYRILQARRGFGATDPRDMIYAHLGLASDRQQLDNYIRVDYDPTFTIGQLYSQVAWYILEKNNLEKFLSLVDVGRTALPGQERVPSWVPDWRVNNLNKTPMHKYDYLSSMKLSGTKHVHLDDLGILAVLGYEVDVLDELGPAMSDGSSVSKEVSSTYWGTVMDILELYNARGGVWYSGDQYGRHPHISIKGREDEHARLGRVLATEWMRFLRQLKEDSEISSECSGVGEGFLDKFGEWSERTVTSERILVTADSKGLVGLLNRFFSKDSKANVLSSRRLAVTRSGGCGVVPLNARKGDVVVNLAGSDMAYVLRSHPLAGTNTVEERIISAFRDAGDFLRDAEGDLWDPSRDDAFSGVFDFIGECYFDEVAAWVLSRRPEKVTVFALA